MADAFANRARQRVVAPVTGAGFFVGRNVRRDQPRHILIRPDVSRSFLARERRRAGFGPICVRMTTKTAHDAVDQVLAARQALRRRFELASGERALLRTDERTPPDREGDSYDYECDEYDERDAC